MTLLNIFIYHYSSQASTPLSDASLMVISESVDVSDNHTTVSIDQIQPNISVVTNASLIRKFSCFEEERGDSFNSTFQVIHQVNFERMVS